MKSFKCQAHFPEIPELYRQFRLHHGLYDGQNLILKCGQRLCCRTLYSYSGLTRHIVSHVPFEMDHNEWQCIQSDILLN